MTDAHGQEHPVEAGAPPPEPGQAPAESVELERPVGPSRRKVWWLATLLLLVIAGIGLSPFWARDVAQLLPWGGKVETSTEEYAALTSRLEAIERHPVLPSPDIGAINSATSALARRVDQLETARNTDRQGDAAAAADKTRLQQLEERLSAFEAKSAVRSAGETTQFEKMRQELAQISSASADLADRLSTIERRVGAAGSTVRADAALLAALLRMREAVEAARPFATEYDGFITLAHDQPDLIAGAQPLAGMAREGVASNAALSEYLGKLSGRTAPAAPVPTGSNIGTQALAWLRSLVTIRRVEAVVETGQEQAMNVAEVALARGDLSGAVSALQTISSAPKSGAIQSWLEMAQQRLAAAAALAHLQDLLVARLGAPSEIPGPAPTEAPVKSAQPS
jgi:hypothetical protein